MFRAIPILLLVLELVAPARADLQTEVDAWHAGRIERLLRPDGWLSLVGLYRLEQGENHFGSAEDNDLVFPAGSPAHAGTIVLDGQDVSLRVAEGVHIEIDGEAIGEAKLGRDVDEETSTMHMGSLRFYVIERVGEHYLRVKDTEAPLLSAFAGIDRFPVSSDWVVPARWVAYDEPKTITVPNILGYVSTSEIDGYLEFEIEGETHRLDPLPAGDELWLIYGDATNGAETYGAGRFLYVPVPDEDGMVPIDFNRSYNPPCIFTPYATCPLPPEGNTLSIRVEAGEKSWGDAHH